MAVKRAGPLNPKAYDKSFITPMSEQRLGAEPGPEIFTAPVIDPADPLKLIPGGGKKGPIGKLGGIK